MVCITLLATGHFTFLMTLCAWKNQMLIYSPHHSSRQNHKLKKYKSSELSERKKASTMLELLAFPLKMIIISGLESDNKFLIMCFRKSW